MADSLNVHDRGQESDVDTPLLALPGDMIEPEDLFSLIEDHNWPSLVTALATEVTSALSMRNGRSVLCTCIENQAPVEIIAALLDVAPEAASVPSVSVMSRVTISGATGSSYRR